MTEQKVRDKPLALIADDDSTARLLTRAALEQAGFSVVEAEDGDQALATFERTRPDLVLLDVDMPGTDGYTVCRTLRSRTDARHVPIVMVTGRDDVLSINQAYEAGATDFVAKPINWGLLGHRVRYILRSGDAVRELAASEEKLKRLSRITAVLSSINSVIVRTRDRKEMLEEACRIAVDHGLFGFAWIGLLDRATMRVEPVAWSGREQGLLKELRLSAREDVPEGQGLAGRTIREKKPIICNDIASDALVQVSRPAVSKGFRSLVFLPLLMEGAAVGVFALYAADAGFFDDEEMKLLQELAGDVSFGLETNEKAQRLDYLAYYDALTGLPNRSLYQERLSRLTEAARPIPTKLAVVVIDVRGFHVVNDNLGRHTGDMLLRLVAQRLRENVRLSDTLGRIGGDQFGLILTDLANETQIGPLLEKLFGSLGEPFPVESEQVRLSVKGGVTVFPTATDGESADALLTNAEAALKKAKASPDTYLFYAPHINAAIANRIALESKLRRALEERQFVLHYQPKVESQTGRIVGLEGLLRWNDPAQGMIPPYQFIPLLEETGLIVEVGSWILRQAMTDFEKLQAGRSSPPRIAVNISSIQMRQKDFPGYVAAAIRGGAPVASGLDIEITESVLMEDIARTVDALSQIRKMGIGVALDDFGTGYSSLNYIAQLPANTLKIDRSFVADMDMSPVKLAIVSAIVSLGHALDMKIVAEGVETEQQAKLLRLIKCDEMQGYLFSKPVPFDQIEVMLANQGSASGTSESSAASRTTGPPARTYLGAA